LSFEGVVFPEEGHLLVGCPSPHSCPRFVLCHPSTHNNESYGSVFPGCT
jgi:hypothetical protein